MWTERPGGSESGADTAAVRADNPILLTIREDHTPAEGIAALVVDQAGPEQRIERIAECGQMMPQISAGGRVDAGLFDSVVRPYTNIGIIN